MREGSFLFVDVLDFSSLSKPFPSKFKYFLALEKIVSLTKKCLAQVSLDSRMTFRTFRQASWV